MHTTRVDGAAFDRDAPDEPDELALAADFPTPDRSSWVALVDQVLRRAGRLDADAPSGAGVEALTWTTPDGLMVGPLYTADDAADLLSTGVPGRRPFVRGGRAAGAVPDGWDVRQWHAEPDPATAREALLADLANGATSIWLAVGGPDGVGTAVADLPAVLDGVHRDLAPVVLDTVAADPDVALRAAETYLGLPAAADPAQLRGALGLDPIGHRARTGTGPSAEVVVPLAVRAAREFPQVKAVVVDGLPVHVAGGSDAQELGYALAAGVAYLRVLTAAGLDVDTAAGLMEFRVAVTAEQFPSIAKLRAARRLWARVLEVSGAAPATAQVQHAVASPTMYTRRDPYGNLLRGTVAGFAAGVGGADAVTVAPFDAALGASTPFSRRIARNTQTLLVMEAHLARVIDPAGGSWFVESLTDALARAAWAFFQELEAAGGVVRALDSGLVGEATARVREVREREVATGRRPVTGVSEHPDLDEKPVPRAGPDLLAGLGFARAGRAGLPVYRPAAPFEAYRDRSDAILAATGARPRAFVATLGPPSAPGAASARNALRAGGIDPVDAGATTTVDDVTTAFATAGTPVAVLCLPDRDSTGAVDEHAAAAVAALRAAGAQHVLLAGEAPLDAVEGAAGHLTAGGDVLAAVYAVLDGPPAEVGR